MKSRTELAAQIERAIVLVASIIGVSLIVFASFALYTTTRQSAHESEVARAEREIRGNRAMISAVCDAFHTRDVSTQNKWRAVTAIELHYKRPNPNGVDAAYHAARRRALLAADISDAQIVAFDCRTAMARAYALGSR